MEVKLIGYAPVDFTDQKTGRRIVGTTLYVVCKNDRVTGNECFKQFTSIPIEPEVGAKYDFIYSRGGGLNEIKKI